MFDARADFRFFCIGAANGVGHRLALGFLAMNAADETVLLHECLVGRGAIGGVRPNVRRRVGLIEQTLA